MSKKYVNVIGWAATILAIAMYGSYIDQIKLNLSGHKGSIILPVVTTVNCITWTMYGFLKPKKDWPIIISCVPGIILGAIAALTAF